ncbi:hypothetical protein BOTBODRAFT_322035 [Botryobasidium botryosum FD-172 SS1]|uniref:FYR N-terminal domain-containing protein n=1 Tax=Botryobasidium botryosum (strain FD-172 SS1) TaxID=930990 RepID=A0A067MYU0_BOTB1|nr:hypothetical protein BOTBODRAFT_322035 [Botryobasidium botryosum FD-172 SS1]
MEQYPSAPPNYPPPLPGSMGPPLPPEAASFSSLSSQALANGSATPKDGPDSYMEKHRKLKKKYLECHKRWKVALDELQRTKQQNVRMKAEKIALLDRIAELQSERPSDNPISTALPRNASLVHHKLDARGLTQAFDSDEEGDPRTASRHVGPAAKEEEEARKRREEEERERRPIKRARTSQGQRRSEGQVPPVIPLDIPGHPPPEQMAPNGVPSAGPSSVHRQRVKPPTPQQRPFEVEGSNGNGFTHSRSPSPVSPRDSPPAPPTPNARIPRATDAPRTTKPKRLKAHTVTSKSFSIPLVPRDKKTGRPALPLNVGIMTVISLGEVCTREHFHTERYIFPVGYEVTRRYYSTVEPTAEAVYTCKILDGGDGPRFQITASDIPDRKMVAGTATGVWSGIVRAANLVRERQHSNSVSGPDYFGLGQNTIKHLIQELPGADQLRDYVWQNFVEGGPLGGRHAAVSAAHHIEDVVLSPSVNGKMPSLHGSQSSGDLRGRPDDMDYGPDDMGRGRLMDDVSPIDGAHYRPPPHMLDMPHPHHAGQGNPYTSPTLHRPSLSSNGSNSSGHNGNTPHSHPHPLPPPPQLSHPHHSSHPHQRPTSAHSTSSPYAQPPGPVHVGYPSPVPPVPPAFASIMNAYPAPPDPRYGGAPLPEETGHRRGRSGSAAESQPQYTHPSYHRQPGAMEGIE